jgi:hypothetical protein
MLLVKTARLESYYPVPGQAGGSMISRLYCGVIRFADSGHGKRKNNKQKTVNCSRCLCVALGRFHMIED